MSFNKKDKCWKWDVVIIFWMISPSKTGPFEPNKYTNEKKIRRSFFFEKKEEREKKRAKTLRKFLKSFFF